MTDEIPDPDGCAWPIDPACMEEDWETNYDEPTKLRAIALASATLRRLTAFRVGGCPITVRPVSRAACAPFLGSWGGDMGGGFIPYMGVDGEWRNLWCGCDTSNPGVVINLLPPVGSVSQVHQDGTLLVEGADYWVSGTRLIRMAGKTWPLNQDVNSPATAANTLSVSYFNSYPVDGLGAYACGKLAMEFAKACAGVDCDLPDNVTQVVRQGVTFTLASGSFPNGETGIREVDAYIALWNPGHRRQGPRVWSPR